MKVKTALICVECNSRNYNINKDKYSNKKITLNKYCPKCNKTTQHVETK